MHKALNSADPNAFAAAKRKFEESARQYRLQWEELMPRLTESACTFFGEVSLHDGTLLALKVGDDIYRRFPTYKNRLTNRRQLIVEIQAMNYEETRLYSIRYERLRRVAFDFPTAEPWYMRFSDPGSNPIDDWMFDELTAVDDQVLSHEVLFSSGTTLRIEFENVTVETEGIFGRQDLPPLDPDEAGE
jgi:hypothetical protein